MNDKEGGESVRTLIKHVDGTATVYAIGVDRTVDRTMARTVTVVVRKNKDGTMTIVDWRIECAAICHEHGAAMQSARALVVKLRGGTNDPPSTPRPPTPQSRARGVL